MQGTGSRSEIHLGVVVNHCPYGGRVWIRLGGQRIRIRR
jgi:hypothetical protein